MKKFFKILFSRFTLIFFAILLQISVAVIVMLYFENYYLPIRVISTALMLIVLLGIINRDMTAEGKLPWAILVALFPIPGMILYLSFSRNYASRRERKLFAKLPRMHFYGNLTDVPLKIVGQLNYLAENNTLTFGNTDTEYFASGEEFFEDLLKELNNAQQYIFMEYFIVERGKMFDAILEILQKKVKSGVEVRFMYDDMGSLPHVRHLFCRQMRKLGIDCVRFGKLKPFVSAVYNNRDHRKITVIDGKVGYTGGINLADEYINETHPFGYWKDTAIKLQGDGVASLCYMFLQMFDMAQNKTENFEQYLVPIAVRAKETVNSKTCGIVAPFADGPKPLYAEYVARNVYMNLINQAEKELYITTPYLIVDEAFSDALCRAAKRGVQTHIVIPGIPDKKAVYCLTKQSCVKLMESGVNIYSYVKGFIHAKGIVADNSVGIVGTINLDYRSFMHHYEDGVYMHETKALFQLKEDMLKTVGESVKYDAPPKLKLWEKIVIIFTNVFRPLL